MKRLCPTAFYPPLGPRHSYLPAVPSRSTLSATRDKALVAGLRDMTREEQSIRLALWYSVGSYLGASAAFTLCCALTPGGPGESYVLPSWVYPWGNWIQVFLSSGAVAIANLGGLIALIFLTRTFLLDQRNCATFGALLGAATSAGLWAVIYVCEKRLELHFLATSGCGIAWGAVCAIAVGLPYLRGKERRESQPASGGWRR